MNNLNVFRVLPRAATAAAAVLLAAVLGLLLPASGAFAHDDLLGSKPAAGETVEQPGPVVLRFSANVLGLGSTVKIQDAEGNDWNDGETRIVDDAMIQKIRPGAPAGEYTVLWRAVSSDSHPIEGTYSFTASGSSEPAQAQQTPAPASPESTPAASTAVPAEPSASAAAPTEAGTETAASGGGNATPLLIGAGVVLLALLAFGAYMVRKKASAGDQPKQQ